MGDSSGNEKPAQSGQCGPEAGSENALHCPKCGSVCVEPIDPAVRGMTSFFFGYASKRAQAQYRCKNCRHKW
ncbi:hypothetical protein H8790_01565 [Oscillibacter hominis]|uniref:Uncharacterized protein n=1 Tax=Oscillibacter hominis TaxID=2763056 RepID=A0A7G9B5D8_9FIRM|nr:hypothetical protein [Oscillibacter hominis]QNL44769.1 hypothetical protein H8790_01565 [Oscillibacter hominis]